MKRYYFHPHTYSAEYHVMAESKERALECVKTYLKHRGLTDPSYADLYMEDHEIWKDATIDGLPLKYTCEEFGVDEVSQTEIS